MPLERRLRTDDPEYLEKVRSLYGQIAGQLKGLLWKDGGPVIGIQLENEYGGPAEHLLTLKRIAREVGLDVPLYTRTGWPNLRTPMPFGEILPLFGGYPEGFWDRNLEAMPGTYWYGFTFQGMRTDAAIATDQLGARQRRDEVDARQYPFLTCELGGGMISSYHRRILIQPMDVAALVLTKVGSGSNLPGYYMYHGGTNPPGKLSTLQESQATNYWNDLPVLNYDYHAPLGEFGQVRPHYHLLRRLHLFLQDWGEQLTQMRAVLPEARPTGRHDAATLRWSIRTNGDGGFVFVNNYQRLLPMPAKTGVQFEVRAETATTRIPLDPVTIPTDSAFVWPFHLDLGGVRLVYATAQPICMISEGDTTYAVFAEIAGTAAEFAFPEDVIIEHSSGQRASADGINRVRALNPGIDTAIRARGEGGRRVAIILLDENTGMLEIARRRKGADLPVRRRQPDLRRRSHPRRDRQPFQPERHDAPGRRVQVNLGESDPESRLPAGSQRLAGQAARSAARNQRRQPKRRRGAGRRRLRARRRLGDQASRPDRCLTQPAAADSICRRCRATLPRRHAHRRRFL
jgi:hypothetical protein